MLKYFDGTKISPNNTLTTKFYILHIFYALLPVKQANLHLLFIIVSLFTISRKIINNISKAFFSICKF